MLLFMLMFLQTYLRFLQPSHILQDLHSVVSQHGVDSRGLVLAQFQDPFELLSGQRR